MKVRNLEIEITVNRKIVVSAMKSVAVLGNKGEKVFFPRTMLSNPDIHANEILDVVKMPMFLAKKWGILEALKCHPDLK